MHRPGCRGPAAARIPGNFRPRSKSEAYDGGRVSPRFHSSCRAGAFLALVAMLTQSTPTLALSVNGGSAAIAGGGPSLYTPLPSEQSTTGPVFSSGTCSRAGSQGWLSAPSGALALSAYSAGALTPTCVAQSDGHGTVDYSDVFTVTSNTLPDGTPVSITLCAVARIRHGTAFGCGGSVYEGVNGLATASVSIVSNTGARSAHGYYAERWNCYDTHDVTTTGLFSGVGSDTTLTLANVPVGATVTVNATLEASSAITSYSASDAGLVELALVFGYTSSSAVRLISAATTKELSPIGNCSADAALAWLPPPPGGTLAADAPVPAWLALGAPFPNPAHGPVSMTLALPREGDVDAAVFDVAGARIATLAAGHYASGEHALVWNARDAGGRAVRAGLYWVRVRTSQGAVSRMVSVR